MKKSDDDERRGGRTYEGPSDLVLHHATGRDQAVRLAVAKVTALAPYPDGYEPDDRDKSYDAVSHRAWLAAEAAANLSISITEKDGYSSELAGIDELAELPERSFESIESIGIVVGQSSYSPPGVSMRLSRTAGLTVEINGYERSWTAGLRHQLEEILKPRHRPHAPLMLSGAHGVVIAVVAGDLTFYAVLGVLGTMSDLQGSTRAAIEFGSAGTVVLLVAVVWLASSRHFELLSPGQRPRYQRWRSKLLAAAGAVILSVIGSVVYAAISS